MLQINKTIPCDVSNYSKASGRKKEYIVIHYTGGVGTAKANATYYSRSLPANSKASAHLFVGHANEGAEVYQSVDPENIAFHCGTSGQYYHPSCRNANSIGIEVCCHNDTTNKTAASKDWYFDSVTIDRLVDLVKELMAQYHIDADHVIRHYDVTHKTCPAMWVHDPAAWAAFKTRLTGDNAVKPSSGGTSTVNISLSILKTGSAGPHVKAAQRLLNGHGFNCGVVDGDFGAKTLTAVKAFQSAKRIIATGTVDQVTWEMLLS